MELYLIFTYLVAMFCTVSSIRLTPEEYHRLLISEQLLRNEREDGRWSWGYIDSKGSDQSQSTTTARAIETAARNSRNGSSNITTTTEAAHPCSPFIPPKRDFSAPGRRISETKCYEFIWDIKIREDENKHKSDCFRYHMQHLPPGMALPNFVVGGRDTTPGEFPHMGAIGWKASAGTWLFKCGSTLISEKFVLTAAHCSSASARDTTIADPVPKIVRLGDKNILDTYEREKKPYDGKIIRIITHPQFSAPKKYFDIALMELENAVRFTKHVQPACLWNKFDISSLGDRATTTGWGVVEAGGRNTSPKLQAGVVDIIETEQCDQLLQGSRNRHWWGVQEHQICAGKLAGGVDACQGDSGGPLQVKIPLPASTEGKIHYVIGVTSFGIGCALPNLPGIYTRVSSFIDWIEDNVWKNVV